MITFILIFLLIISLIGIKYFMPKTIVINEKPIKVIVISQKYNNDNNYRYKYIVLDYEDLTYESTATLYTVYSNDKYKNFDKVKIEKQKIHNLFHNKSIYIIKKEH